MVRDCIQHSIELCKMSVNSAWLLARCVTKSKSKTALMRPWHAILIPNDELLVHLVQSHSPVFASGYGGNA